ncbi:MAG: glycosyltransferase family 1 protein [Planctomycetes bacterium]|nr:glycosyltransferase family 1 protein [Planctomycetota bacterium]
MGWDEGTTQTETGRSSTRRTIALGGRVPVAMVAACPFPANRGTPIRIRQMGEALDAAGYDVHVITYHLGTELSIPGMTIHRTRAQSRYTELAAGPTWTKLAILDPLLVLRIGQVVRRHGIRVVHAHHFEGALCALAARSLVGGFKVLYDAHTTLSDELHTYRNFRGPRFLKKIATEMLDSGLPRWCDHVVTVSERLRSALLDRGIPDERISVIPMAINREEFNTIDIREAKQRIGYADVPLVVYAGNLSAFQGVDHLLRAFRSVAASLPQTRLLIVGRPVDVYRNMVRDLGLDPYVVFVGERPFSEVRLHIAAADVVVLPRDNCIGFPLKLLNYMAAGKPIVAFHGGAGEVLTHLRNAYVVPDDHEEAFAAGIMTCLQHPSLPQRLAASARLDAQRYGARAMVDRVHSLYRKVLLPGPAPSGALVR